MMSFLAIVTEIANIVSAIERFGAEHPAIVAELKKGAQAALHELAKTHPSLQPVEAAVTAGDQPNGA